MGLTGNGVIIDLETIPDRTIWGPPPPPPEPPAPAPMPPLLPAGPFEAFARTAGGVTVPGGVAFPGGMQPQAAPVTPAPAEAPATPPKRGRGRPPKAATAPNGNGAPAAPAAPARRGKVDGEGFAPLWAHQIVVAGIALIQNGVPTQLGVLTASTLDEERALLAQLAGILGNLEVPIDVTVGWNSRGFDLGVIELRSLRHGVAQPWYDTEARKRYGSRHVDLCDSLSAHGLVSGGKTGFKLDVFAKLIGLPGKMGFDGSMVEAAFVAGELAKIANYCATDVVQTAYIYLRHCVVWGKLTGEEYNNACAALYTQWHGKPGFEAFKPDFSRLLLPG